MKYIVVEWDFTKIILKQKYNPRERVKLMLRRKRKQASIGGGGKSKANDSTSFQRGDAPLPLSSSTPVAKGGCIVRWDYQPVKTTIPRKFDKRAAFRKRQGVEAAPPKNGTPPSRRGEPHQGKGG